MSFLREKSRRGREYIINGVDIMCGIVGYVGEEQAARFCLAACLSWSTEDMILRGSQ